MTTPRPSTHITELDQLATLDARTQIPVTFARRVTPDELDACGLRISNHIGQHAFKMLYKTFYSMHASVFCAIYRLDNLASCEMLARFYFIHQLEANLPSLLRYMEFSFPESKTVVADLLGRCNEVSRMVSNSFDRMMREHEAKYAADDSVASSVFDDIDDTETSAQPSSTQSTKGASQESTKRPRAASNPMDVDMTPPPSKRPAPTSTPTPRTTPSKSGKSLIEADHGRMDVSHESPASSKPKGTDSSPKGTGKSTTKAAPKAAEASAEKPTAKVMTKTAETSAPKPATKAAAKTTETSAEKPVVAKAATKTTEASAEKSATKANSEPATKRALAITGGAPVVVVGTAPTKPPPKAASKPKAKATSGTSLKSTTTATTKPSAPQSAQQPKIVGEETAMTATSAPLPKLPSAYELFIKDHVRTISAELMRAEPTLPRASLPAALKQKCLEAFRSLQPAQKAKYDEQVLELKQQQDRTALFAQRIASATEDQHEDSSDSDSDSN